MERGTPLDRLDDDTALYRLAIVRQLGAGVHGSVFASSCQTAIKVHEFPAAYQREKLAYIRLNEHHVEEVHGFAVPQLIQADDDLLILEMTIVSPPFVLDFGGAYLDGKPEFPPETLAEWEADKQEQFGEDWPAARQVIAAPGFPR